MTILVAGGHITTNDARLILSQVSKKNFFFGKYWSFYEVCIFRGHVVAKVEKLAISKRKMGNISFMVALTTNRKIPSPL